MHKVEGHMLLKQGQPHALSIGTQRVGEKDGFLDAAGMAVSHCFGQGYSLKISSRFSAFLRFPAFLHQMNICYQTKTRAQVAGKLNE